MRFTDHISSDYYGGMLNNINLLVGKYNASYLNYLKDKRFEIDDFLDNDHLNEEGAKKFSLILKADI